METTRRGLFQMFAAAFAAAGVPLRAQERPRPAVHPAKRPQTQPTPTDHSIEIREVHSVWFDREAQIIDITSLYDDYRRFALDPSAPVLICVECEPTPELRGLVVNDLQQQKFKVRLERDGELRFSGWLRSITPYSAACGRMTYQLKFQVNEASYNSLALL